MRITAGSLRGRPIAAPPGRNIRPSSDRLREALFNILAHAKWDAIPPMGGARILDAFAGTGALGLEALSRGAALAVFIDRDLTWVRRNIEALGQTDRTQSITADATAPPPTEAPVDIAFLDHPTVRASPRPRSKHSPIPAGSARGRSRWSRPARGNPRPGRPVSRPCSPVTTARHRSRC